MADDGVDRPGMTPTSLEGSDLDRPNPAILGTTVVSGADDHQPALGGEDRQTSPAARYEGRGQLPVVVPEPTELPPSLAPPVAGQLSPFRPPKLPLAAGSHPSIEPMALAPAAAQSVRGPSSS